MRDDQYALFRDLDRRCVARSLPEADCREAVRMKRASIESDVIRRNPLVREVLAGRTTFVAIYDSFSRGARGIRRFLPRRHDPEHNQRLMHFAEIVPNVRHFTRRSILAADNPISGLIYGLVVSVAVGMIWAHSARGDVEADQSQTHVQVLLSMVLAAVGFLLGLLAMFRYRTRNPNAIHAREAAAYMDLNYAFYRNGDDRAWAEFIRAQSDGGRVVLARPDDNG